MAITDEHRKAKQNAYARAWRLANPEKAKAKDARDAAARIEWKSRDPSGYASYVRKNNLRAFYGISPEQYESMLFAQGGRCAICRTDSPEDRYANFAVDHNHSTGAVRGILCHKCNAGIGCLGDRAENLLAAAEYLRGRIPEPMGEA